MEMNSPVSVILSSNDALSSQRSKMIVNSERVEVVTLGVGEEHMFASKPEGRHVSCQCVYEQQREDIIP